MSSVDNYEGSYKPDKPLKRTKREPKAPAEPEKPKVRPGWSRIEVSKNDIKSGSSASAITCPVARACSRCINGAYLVRIFHTHMSVYFGAAHGGWEHFELPEYVIERIKLFDVDGKMEPFVFEIVTHPSLLEKE